MEGIGKEQISTEIARMLREKGCSIANWVNDYLPPKFKNKNLIRINESVNKIVEIGTNTPCHLPEDCSSSELELLYESNEKAIHEADNLRTRLAKDHDKLEYIAQQKGQQLGGYKFRREISHKDFNEEVPSELLPLITENRNLFLEWADTIKVIGEKYYIDPPRKLEELKQDNQILKVEIFKWKGHGGDYKSTGDVDHSMERQYVSDLHGKHAAGNSDKFPTKLCSFCSQHDTFDPDDFEIMHYDHTSPSNYRCRKCGGVEVIMRGMSREQVGDRAAFIIRQAQNIIAAEPIYGITLHRWIKDYVQVKEDSRKAVISQFFSDSSMGQSFRVAHNIPKEK